jgi:hypothetical protein
MKQKIEIGVKQKRKYRTPTFYDLIGNKEKIYFDYVSLNELCKELTQLLKEYDQDFENLRIEQIDEYEVMSFHLVGTRLETDEEYLSRVKAEESAQRQKESKDRQEFERLKKKFESEQQ